MICSWGETPRILSSYTDRPVGHGAREHGENRIVDKDVDVGSKVGCVKMAEMKCLNIGGKDPRERSDIEKGSFHVK